MTKFDDFYEVLAMFDDNIFTVALLIKLFRQNADMKIVQNLENLKINDYSLEFDKILQLNIKTLRDLKKGLNYER
ncbi:MAG: hypothetical protein LRY52_11195 [Sulfurospirillum cavolei]|nr:hypothetical protein [Sulfurospirillum cavolei]